MENKSIKISRWEKIGKMLVIEWILHLLVLFIIGNFLRPASPTPIWFRQFMWIGFISWILLTVPFSLSYGYTFFRDCRRKQLIKILDMADNEVIEYLKNRNYGYYRFLREISYDGQIVSKIKDASKDMLSGITSKNGNNC